jgi:tetratricopeptide (TPR) repeat protein
MGHEYMELRNTAAAVQCYRSALVVSELDYRAWYGLGQTYEMLHLYQYAHYYFKKAAFLRPSDARMWSAVGNCLLRLNLRSDAIATYERAVSSGDREGMATRDLARLYRDDHQIKRASELYYTYLQCTLFEPLMNPDDEQPMPHELDQLVRELNDNVTSDYLNIHNAKYNAVETVSDAEQAEAVLFLAHYFKKQDEHVVSEFFCSK